MEKREQMDKPLRDLIEIIHFTENVSARTHGVLDEAEIYRAAMEEFAKSKRYTASILVLTDDRLKLRIAGASIPPEKVKAGEEVTRLRLKEYEIDLSKSSIYSQVVREGKTVQANVSYIIGELFPRPLASLISKTMGYEKKSSILTPLRRRGKIIGVLAMSSTDLAEYFITSVRNLAQHISTALELADENAERKRVEEELRESNRQLEGRERLITHILDSIPSSLVVFDRALRVVSTNRNFLEKTRREAQDTLGHKLEEVFPQVLMEYTQLAQKAQDVFRTGQLVEGGQLSYRAPGLSTRIYYYRLIPLLALSRACPEPSRRTEGTEEAVENMMLLMDDITEREKLGEEMRRAERHLASVVECANDLVVSMDPQGHIVTWNQAAEKTSGLKTEEVKGQSLTSLCATEQQQVMAKMLQGLARGESIQNVEVSLFTADGREVPIAWSCSPMRDDAGEMVGIVTVGRDLTEQRRLETQLLQSTKMASLGVMAGGIAHELRNPLGIILASAQLLQEHADDAQLHTQCAEKIHAATQRASLIIENLLKFARPTGERMREVDLKAVLEETLALLAHQMTLQKITLRKEFQPDLPRMYGNPALLQQVFTNLILNARNAMPQGGALTVVTQATEAGLASSRDSARGVEIRFSDTGHGIPPENLPKVFDPFFTTMPVGKGTGLGLSISYSIVQQHQGTIEVESQVGKGTTFTIRLPGTSDGR